MAGDFDWLGGVFVKIGIPIAIVVGLVLGVKACITG
jgi:hypothetical protein